MEDLAEFVQDNYNLIGGVKFDKKKINNAEILFEKLIKTYSSKKEIL